MSLRLSFQRVFNFRGTRWNIDKCVTVAYWSRLVNVYPETSFESLSKAIYVLHYSLRQYSQYTAIGRTALVTSQIQGKRLAATEIKGDKQDNKLSALINQRSNQRRYSYFLPQKIIC